DGKVSLLWATAGKNPPINFARSEVSLPGTEASCLIAADVTGDGRPDLVAGTTGKAVYVVAAQRDRQWQKVVAILAMPATHVAVGDLDRDGHADLVLTYFTEAHAAGGEKAGTGKDAHDRVHILWGGREGFHAERSTTVKVRHAVATAVGDLDG